MTELKDNPIYRLLEEHYPNLLVDYYDKHLQRFVMIGASLID